MHKLMARFTVTIGICTLLLACGPEQPAMPELNFEESLQQQLILAPASYTHLTLPTIRSV